MIDLTNGLDLRKSPMHYARFGKFDSQELGLFLNSRFAPTPEEREVSTTIPYRQGKVDLSCLSGARIYENREITYVFYKFGVKKEMVSVYQTQIENLVMVGFEQELYESYDEYYHYFGKCKSVETEDEYSFNRLRITLTFDLYPFKICNFYEGQGIWDIYNTLSNEPQMTKFTVSGSKDVILTNYGQNVANPIVVASAPFTVTSAGQSYSYPAGTTSESRLRLLIGENKLSLSGTGTIEFLWRTELI